MKNAQILTANVAKSCVNSSIFGNNAKTQQITEPKVLFIWNQWKAQASFNFGFYILQTFKLHILLPKEKTLLPIKDTGHPSKPNFDISRSRVDPLLQGDPVDQATEQGGGPGAPGQEAQYEDHKLRWVSPFWNSSCTMLNLRIWVLKDIDINHN